MSLRHFGEARSTGRVVVAMLAVVAGLMVLGWGTLFVIVLPGHYVAGDGAVFGIGVALTAFVLGMRHGFDADHIAAIDNTTRSLVGTDGRPPVSVGFWFALGHSTVVVVAVALMAAGVNALARQIADEDSVLVAVTGVWGPLISGIFLLLIGTVNLVSLAGIWRVFRRLRRGEYDADRFEVNLRGHGVVARLLSRVTGYIDRPWKMYPVGLLFGLGLDTATTIGLFVIGSGAAMSAPWYVVLVLPVLFAAGMTLFDTVDGIVMSRAYRWAYAQPVRRVYYNLTVTAMSVAVAFLVAAVTLASLAPPQSWLDGLDLEGFGLVIVALLISTWVGAVAYWKVGDVERRYSAND